MPRVYSQKAGKDYPGAGIKKGQTYYKWKFRYGGWIRSSTYPKSSQLTQSKWSQVYEAQEELDETLGTMTEPGDKDEIIGAFESAADTVEEVAEEYRESAENIRQSFAESPTADECEERADHLDGLASELWDVDSSLDDDEDASSTILVQARDYFEGLDWDSPV